MGVGASGLLGAGASVFGALLSVADLAGELDRAGASLFGALLAGADLSWLFLPGCVAAIDMPQPVLAPNPPDNVCVPVRKGSALALPRVVRVLRLARVTVGRCRGFAITQSHLRCN